MSLENMDPSLTEFSEGLNFGDIDGESIFCSAYPISQDAIHLDIGCHP